MVDDEEYFGEFLEKEIFESHLKYPISLKIEEEPTFSSSIIMFNQDQENVNQLLKDLEEKHPDLEFLINLVGLICNKLNITYVRIAKEGEEGI